MNRGHANNRMKERGKKKPPPTPNMAEMIPMANEIEMRIDTEKAGEAVS